MTGIALAWIGSTILFGSVRKARVPLRLDAVNVGTAVGGAQNGVGLLGRRRLGRGHERLIATSKPIGDAIAVIVLGEPVGDLQNVGHAATRQRCAIVNHQGCVAFPLISAGPDSVRRESAHNCHPEPVPSIVANQV
jgi:hypothetical protein